MEIPTTTMSADISTEWEPLRPSSLDDGMPMVDAETTACLETALGAASLETAPALGGDEHFMSVTVSSEFGLSLNTIAPLRTSTRTKLTRLNAVATLFCCLLLVLTANASAVSLSGSLVHSVQPTYPSHSRRVPFTTFHGAEEGWGTTKRKANGNLYKKVVDCGVRTENVAAALWNANNRRHSSPSFLPSSFSACLQYSKRIVLAHCFGLVGWYSPGDHQVSDHRHQRVGNRNWVCCRPTVNMRSHLSSPITAT